MGWCGSKDCRLAATVSLRDTKTRDVKGSMNLGHEAEFFTSPVS